MDCTSKVAFPQGAMQVAGVFVFLLTLAAPHLPGELQAQEDSSTPPDLSSVWQRSERPVTPAPEDLPLNARGIAMRDAIDEAQHPMYDCVPAAIPHILGDPYNFSIEQQQDRVIIQHEKDEIRRTIWLDGHGHRAPTSNDFSVQGYSTGRYENGDLVVETTHFTFDPSGIEDKPPMVPSSTSKRTVERYSREGDRLTVNVSVEDPRFLTEPIEFSFQFEPTEASLVDWIPCDPSHARNALRYIPEAELKYGLR